MNEKPVYGCHNRAPYADRVSVGAELVMEAGEVRSAIRSTPVMARECQYTLSELGRADSKCTGCKWRKDDV